MAFDEEYCQLPRWTEPANRVPVFVDGDIPAGFRFIKVTQRPAEVLTGSRGNVRVTQEAAEVLTGTVGKVRGTQSPVEIIVAPNPPIDEYYWLNWVAPITAKLYQKLPLGDPEEIPAGFPRSQVEEYYWQNRVLPVPPSMYLSPLFVDPEEIPAASLYLAFAKLTHMPVEIIVGYRYNPYVGWTGTSMSVS